MSADDVIWHDVECGGYDADLPLWRELAAAEARAGARRRRRHRPRGARARRAPATRDRARPRPRAARRAARARAARAGSRSRTRAGRRRRLRRSPSRRSASIAVPMQTIQLLPDAQRARLLRRRARARSRPAGCVALAIADELEAVRGDAARCRRPTSASATAGATSPSRSRSAIDGDRVVIERVRQPIAPDGDARRREDDAIALADAHAPASSRPRAAPPACEPEPARYIAETDDHVGSAGGDAAWLTASCASARCIPDLMNIYADRGNLLLLERRCEWRGIGFELAGAGLGDALDPDAHDLFYIGGGQDRDQALCAQDLATVKRDALHAAAERGAVDLRASAAATSCSATATSSAASGCRASASSTSRPCARTGPRLIGNVAIEVDLGGGPQVLAGFENHGGRTHLGPRRAAARAACCKGHGNDGARRLRGRPRRRRTARSSAPTCTARCCPRTPGSPTG